MDEYLHEEICKSVALHLKESMARTRKYSALESFDYPLVKSKDSPTSTKSPGDEFQSGTHIPLYEIAYADLLQRISVAWPETPTL